MKKRTYFDTHDGPGWPDKAWLEPYFLTTAGRRKFFESGNDSWGLKAYGVGGTNHLLPHTGRIDLDLTILGNPEHGVLLCYQKSGSDGMETHYSKGDLQRLHEWVKTMHGDLSADRIVHSFRVGMESSQGIPGNGRRAAEEHLVDCKPRYSGRSISRPVQTA